MAQKVIKVGESAAVIIPKKSLKDLGLKIGDRVSVEIDKQNRAVTVRPLEKLSREEEKIARLTLNFIGKYRKDLEGLSKKEKE